MAKGQRTLSSTLARAISLDRVGRTLIGLALIAVGAITLLTMLGLNAGGLMTDWTTLLQRAFGIGVFLVCLIAIGVGVWLVLNKPIYPTRRMWVQIILAEVAFFSFLALIHTLAFGADAYQLTLNGGGGGAAGWVLAEGLWQLLGVKSGSDVTAMRLLSVLMWFVVFAFTAFVAVSPLLQSERRIVAIGTSKVAPQPKPAEIPITQPANRGERERPQTTDHEPALSKPIRGTQLHLQDAADKRTPKSAPAPAIKSNPTIINPDDTGASKSEPKARAKPGKPYSRPDTLPPMELLKAAKEVKNSDADAKRQASVIETTLAQLGLAGKVTEIRRGPTVTQFGIEPGYMDRGSQNREKVAQRMRNAIFGALSESIDVQASVDKTDGSNRVARGHCRCARGQLPPDAEEFARPVRPEHERARK